MWVSKLSFTSYQLVHRGKYRKYQTVRHGEIQLNWEIWGTWAEPRSCPENRPAGLDICSHQHPDLQTESTRKSWTQERPCCPRSPAKRQRGGCGCDLHTDCYHTEACLLWDLARFCRDPLAAPGPDHHTSCFMERSSDCKVWNTKNTHQILRQLL